MVDGFIYVANAEPGKGERTGVFISLQLLYFDYRLTLKMLVIFMETVCLAGGGKSEVAQIRAVLNCVQESASKPLLVLSCISREQVEGISEARCQTPCVYMANRLGLPQLSNRWMVIVDSLTLQETSIYCQFMIFFNLCFFLFVIRCRIQWQSRCLAFWRELPGCSDVLVSNFTDDSFLSPAAIIIVCTRFILTPIHTTIFELQHVCNTLNLTLFLH